ncbi:pseudouridine-5'-phosphate glycosidase [Serratia fonticola]|uniref:pseudouridine-5'-phosphate glycosidase n=1 Tax=Serratia fonticola TaxID=47917 RepID=UPI001AE49478|nr:pseudouridine-5'-phosphate glycosidase [Serratia fonticola]MBP1038837.1 pseudouridine-5'-phosphate glycosidase [Serratia fonticola]
MIDCVNISKDIKDALDSDHPVIGLESTILAHGVPYPGNVEFTINQHLDTISVNVMPAMMAIIDGKINVGLSVEQIELIGSQGSSVKKISTRDIPFAINKRETGAMTVAATILMCSKLGIPLCVTGGIGGVHRGAETSFDVSADLIELSKNRVAVVSAGIKSILDIPKTLEFLETRGVPVIGYKSNSLPAFFTGSSNYNVDYSYDSPTDIAKVMLTQKKMGLNNGMLIANPIPKKYELAADFIDAAIEKALMNASEKGISGKLITPFLLNEIAVITSNRSVESDISLVINNTNLAAQIAIEFKRLTSWRE